MDANPYESPRPGTAVDERVPNGATNVLQLLTEIRDAQRDLLELQRQALDSQQQMLQKYRGFGRFGSTLFFIPVRTFILISFGMRWYFFQIPTRPPFTPPVPARVAPRPPIVSPSASLDQPAAR